MRVLAIVAILGAFLSITTHAWAEAKPLPLFWWNQHWDQAQTPYVEESRTSHSYRWENDDWTPQDWIAQHGSKDAVISVLTNANIIKEFDDTSFWGHFNSEVENDELPVLEVGYAFQQISSRQKRRVAKFVGYAYNVQGAMLLEDAKTHAPVGVYTKLGLQLN